MIEENNELIGVIQRYQESTNSIIEGKDREISDLSIVVLELTKRLEEFEDAKPRPTGEPGMGVV